MNRRLYHKELFRIIGETPPLDGVLGLASMQWHLDLRALEDILIKRGDFDPEESIEDYVLRVFGGKAVRLIKQLL